MAAMYLSPAEDLNTVHMSLYEVPLTVDVGIVDVEAAVVPADAIDGEEVFDLELPDAVNVNAIGPSTATNLHRPSIRDIEAHRLVVTNTCPSPRRNLNQSTVTAGVRSTA